MRNIMIIITVFAWTAFALAAPKYDDEFVGPFASWVNVKTECGAIGDGKADDTAAIQKGLDIINPANAKRKVLYLPAGTYRITGTLNVPRTEHAQTIGMSIVGEDPATTTIKWDGVQDGRMWYYCPWYASMMRLTLDGSGKAKDAIFHGLPFATALSYTDMVFKDVQFGIETGERDGIAETLALRCKFIRCSKAGVSIQNFNTLDWWFLYCQFQDCHIGVSSEYNGGGGHFHVYESLFQRSTEADMTMMHTSYFGIRNNTSINSKAFLLCKRAGNWSDAENHGASTTIQGNLIIDPIDSTPIRIANSGPFLLMDNVIRSHPSVKTGPIVRLETPIGDGDLVAIGNTFTVAQPYQVKGRLSVVDDKVVTRRHISAKLPILPSTAPNLHRRVFEVPAGANTETIQQIINDAAKLTGQRPVIHFVYADYAITQTLEIPARSDMILVGEGILNATNLNWAGQGKQPIFFVHGPSHVIFREMNINCGNTAIGVRIDNCDQIGGRINLQETWFDSAQSPPELYVDGLDYTNVSTIGSGVGKITAIGGPLAQQGKRKGTQIVCYGMGPHCQDSFEVRNGGSVLQRDGWYEGGYRTYMRLSGEGTFTKDGGTIAVGTYSHQLLTPEDEGKPAIAIDHFTGKVTFIGTSVSSVDPTRPPNIEVKGGHPDMRVLFLGCGFQPETFINTAPEAKVAFFHCRKGVKDLGTASIPNQGTVDAAFLRAMLAQTREARLKPLSPLKLDVTDVRFDRVFFRNGPRSIELLATDVTPNQNEGVK